ncbi:MULTISPECIES: hypothetical protein [Cryobacterium]|uniref:Uncharacterized protein n=1 Tax=Cryobacterium levicorallinum TaxID=995038 RepID=A0A4R8VEU1_9MICO|nr:MULTISPECIES: hypothetical protein [Cryobacterium]TFB82036.1 hypothetical protein E3O11_15305 [Cryobacterium levicorallinum]TFD57003.1 hypothetical protein E3T41_13390 [Cryobacterium sp. Hh38]GEP27966.1 hypothetical protein CLE01_25640 [Cryobacterium levicorallinum]
MTGTITAKRQVVDVPPIRAETVEHRRIEKLCRCDIGTTGVFPADVKYAVSYGPRLHAVCAYLINVHYLHAARTAAVFNDLFLNPVFHIAPKRGLAGMLNGGCCSHSPG